MQEQKKEILRVEHLKKYFTTPKGTLHAVDDVNFSIRTGETLGVVGESGCGKSTLGRTLIRLLDATSGTIEFDGMDIMGMKDKEFAGIRRQMQIIFQDPYASLNPRMNVKEIISEPLTTYGLAKNRAEVESQVQALMDEVGIPREFINRYPHQFSGGQRQRIGIARALAAEPEFIVCDEPISALDVSIQAQVINILEELQDKFHFTYLFISHDLSMVRHISSEVGVMYLGNLIEYAQVDELYDNMLHPYTQSLISAVPVADPKLAKENQRIILEGDVPSPINPAPGCPFRSRCRYAKDICGQVKPELKAVNDKHKVACHLFD